MTTATFLAPDVVDEHQADDDPSPPAASSPAADPDAPYGRNGKGQPYKRPPEWREKLASRLAQGRATQARQKPPQRTRAKTSTTRAGSSASVDYRPAVAALIQIPAAVTAVLARVTGKKAFALDTATLKLHSPTLASAGHDWATQDPRVAALLDHALAISPAAVFIGAILPVCLQIGANHGYVEPMPDMGILDAEQLLQAAYEQP